MEQLNLGMSSPLASLSVGQASSRARRGLWFGEASLAQGRDLRGSQAAPPAGRRDLLESAALDPAR